VSAYHETTAVREFHSFKCGRIKPSSFLVASVEVTSMLVNRRRFPMCRSIKLLAILMTPIAALAVLPGTALGDQPIARFHDHFEDSFSDVIFGIPVDVDVEVNHNIFLYADGDIKVTGSSRVTYTNPVNGKSIIVSAAGQTTETSIVVDEEAGTISFVLSYKGLPEKIQTAHGPVLSRDAGIITFEETWDLVTGEVISEETIVEKGPHPEADSDFTLFMVVFTAALT